MKEKRYKSARIIVCLMLSLIFLIGMIPGTAFAATIILPPGSTSADLQTAIDGAASGDIIEMSSNMTFSSTVTIPNGKEVTILSTAGNIWTLTQPPTGVHFQLYNASSLILQDIILDGGTVGGGVSVSNNGTLTMNDGSAIQNCNKSTTTGGGVYFGASGILNMYGGVISGNTSAYSGGGVYLSSRGTMNMSGGVISGNSAALNGGGVYITGTLNMTGGIISDNLVKGNGAGVYLPASSTLNMSAGQINDNTAIGNGGGVYVYTNGTLNISGGEISSNAAAGDGSGTATGNGGGVFSYGRIEITAGSINKNAALNSGGGIDARSPLIMSGGDISNNSSAGGGGVSGSNFTMTAGDIKGNKARIGAGIEINGGTFRLDGGTISDNLSTGYGGGVNIYSNSTFTMNSGTIRDNDSPNGGGVCVGTNCKFTMNNGTIISNTSTSGGGVQVNSSSTFDMYDGTIKENIANSGGGIYVENSSFNLHNGTISENTARYGGGVELYSGTFNMSGGSLEDNTATSYGGGAVIRNGTFTASNATINNNSATQSNGGGIYVENLATLKITGSSTITNNSAPNGNGGGIYTVNTAYTNIVTASDTVFEGNTAIAVHLPPENATILYPDMKFADTSILNHPLNNYDINYQTGQLLTYHIIYNANGGTGSYTGPEIGYGYADTVLSLADTGIRRTGYTFIKWNSEPDDSGTPYDPGEEITLKNNVTLYAIWELNEYTVTFNSNGGTPVASQTVSYGDKVTKPATPTKTGYTFMGWYTDDGTFDHEWDFDADIVTDDMTLYAKWEANEYTVTFNSNGGTPVASQTVSYEDKVTKPAPPTKAGYTFMGWYTDDGTFDHEWDFDTDVVTENITLYAQWELDEYTVTFNSNGGTPVASQTAFYGDKVTEPAPPTRNEYIFMGWYTDNGIFENKWDFDTDVVTENLTLYAKWISKACEKLTVTFDSNGGTSVSSQIVFSGEKATEPKDPTKQGYTFAGWYTDNGKFEYEWYFIQYAVTENITLYAKWTPNECEKFTVAFDSNGGTPVSRQIVFSGEKATEPKDPTKQGYTFAGWYTDNGTFNYKWDFYAESVTEDVTLYAKWIPNECQKCTVTFRSNCGTPVNKQIVICGEKATQPKDPKRAGYTFEGWYTDNGTFKHKWNFNTDVVKEDITLYAKWKIKEHNECTVWFDSNGGTSVRSQTVTEGDKATNPKNPTRAGYTFEGWYTDNCTFKHKWNFDRDTVKEDITLYAKWKANKYKVTFDSNGGTAVKSQTVTVDEKAIKPKDPTRAGYTFEGWYTDDGAFKHQWNFDRDTVKEDITLYAKWKEKTHHDYAVLFDSNGGTAVSSETISEGEKAIKPKDPTRAGYTFEGWYTDNGTFKHQWDFNTDVVTEDITLYAKWKEKTHHDYAVLFDSNGGTAVSSETISEGEKAIKPKDPTRAGYTFEGWYTDDGTFKHQWDFNTDVVKENITLYAKWKATSHAEYTVLYDSNGGTAVKSQTVSDGEKATKPQDPVRVGYTFAGWYTDNGTFGNEWDFAADITKDIILFAKWTKNSDPSKPSDPLQPSKTKSPKTDDNHISLWMLYIVLIAAGVLLWFAIKNQIEKQKAKKEPFL